MVKEINSNWNIIHNFTIAGTIILVKIGISKMKFQKYFYDFNSIRDIFDKLFNLSIFNLQ